MRLLSDYLTRIMRLLEADKVRSRWTDSELIDYLSDAALEHRNDRMRIDPDYYVESALMSAIGVLSESADELQEFEFSDYVEHIRRIEKVGALTSLEEFTQRALRERRPASWEFFEGFIGCGDWSFAGPRRIVFDRSISTSEARAWFIRTMPRCARVTLTAGTTTSATFSLVTAPIYGSNSLLTDAYVGARIAFASAGNAEPQGRVRKVRSVSLAYPNLTLSFDALPAAADPGDLIDFLPLIEDRDYELVCHYAARRALTKGGAVTQKAAVQEDSAKLLHTATQLSDQREDAATAHVIFDGDSF